MKNFFALCKRHKVVTAATASVLVIAVFFACLGALFFTRFSKGTVPTEEDLVVLRNGGYIYDRVAVIGIDGAGGWFDKCDTPNFDRIFSDGSVTFTGLSQYPTTSAHNWTSMLHGVRYQKHKINNEKAKSIPFSNEKYPSVFQLYAERHPEAQFISAASWAPVNVGIVEDLPGMVKISGERMVEEAGLDLKRDDPFTEKADEMTINALLDKLAEDAFDPKIAFVHLNRVDEYGHKYGSNATEYKEAIESADVLVGKVYDAYAARGWRDNTLFILATDHGHRMLGGHGMNGKREREITVAVAGNLGNVKQGTPGKVVSQDVAAIVMYALGEKQPDNWDAKVPFGMFTTLE